MSIDKALLDDDEFRNAAICLTKMYVSLPVKFEQSVHHCPMGTHERMEASLNKYITSLNTQQWIRYDTQTLTTANIHYKYVGHYFIIIIDTKEKNVY
jgi:hypothetical protein